MTKMFRIFTDLHMFVLRSYNLLYLTVTYAGHLGDQCIGLGTQTLAPKKHFPSNLFSVMVQ